MTDIVERLRRRYFSPVAVFRNPDGPEAADEIERLRAERDALRVECYAVGENYEIAKRGQLSAEAERDAARAAAMRADILCDQQHDEIERLRADLLKAEMRAEIAGLENIMRAVARGRREGIEAALEIVKQWPPHMVVPNLRALLEDKP